MSTFEGQFVESFLDGDKRQRIGCNRFDGAKGFLMEGNVFIDRLLKEQSGKSDSTVEEYDIH